MAALPVLRLVQAGRRNIHEALLCEEAVMRACTDNWLLQFQGTAPPQIVMGISAKPHQVVNLAKARRRRVPVLRRFTGGGTVIVDHNTLFTSLIMNASDVPCKPFARDIMAWTEGAVYKPAFEACAPSSAGSFLLNDVDYCFGDLKFGGNAQAISKGRWVHHTSFLWDMNPENMDCLRMPPTMPAYRAGRPHDAFLTTLSRHVASPEDFHAAVVSALAGQFQVQAASWEDFVRAAAKPARHKRVTTKVEDLTGLRQDGSREASRQAR